MKDMNNTNHPETLESKSNNSFLTVVCYAGLIAALVVLGIKLSHFLPTLFSNAASSASSFVENMVVGLEGEISEDTTITLSDVLNISELATLRYNYDAVAKVYDEKTGNISYYVAYKGVVTLGIDFNDVTYLQDSESKHLTVYVPCCEVQSVHPLMESLDFIFANKKAQTETIAAAAYSECEKDLKTRVVEDQALLTMANNNTLSTIEALVRPWIEQLYPEYSLTFCNTTK